MKPEEKLKHASSRRVILEGKRVVKFYPSVYGYVLHDLAFMIFSLFFFRAIVPISTRKRIRNEIEGRKVLSKMGIKTTKLNSFSKNSVEEEFESTALTINELESLNPKKTLLIAKEIGKITRKLHERNFYFIDNRTSNWMFNKRIIRTDLELFRSSSKQKDFFVFCDILSFLSTLEDERIREKFLEGYGRRFKVSRLLQLLVAIYIKLTDSIF